MDELIIIIFSILLAFLMVFSFIADRRELISADLMHTFDQMSILIDAIEDAISTNPEELNKYYDINEEGKGEYFELVTKDFDKKLYISNPKSNIAVGSIQMFLDEYLKDHVTKTD